jgi:hypothetical protein
MARKPGTVVYDLTARQIDRLTRDLQAARAQLADLEREIADLEREIAELLERGAQGAGATAQAFRAIRVPIVGVIKDGLITFKADPEFVERRQRQRWVDVINDFWISLRSAYEIEIARLEVKLELAQIALTNARCELVEQQRAERKAKEVHNEVG